MLNAIRSGLVASAHDVAEGGLAVAVAESLMGTNGLGAMININGNKVSALFSESQSRFLISVKKEHQHEFESLVAANLIGEVTELPVLHISSEDGFVFVEEVEKLRQVWKGAIPCLLK